VNRPQQSEWIVMEEVPWRVHLLPLGIGIGIGIRIGTGI